MPRVVPSDVVKAIERMFPQMIQDPRSFPDVSSDSVPPLKAIAQLVESVPEDLLILDPAHYAELIASVAYLRSLGDSFQAARSLSTTRFMLAGFDLNPLALIQQALVACPDEGPAAGTEPLAFIGDLELRESIRLDLSAAHRDLSAGEWKGATVLAGSATEALLLWALQEHDVRHPGALATATRALVAAGTIPHPRDPKPEEWILHTYVEVAAHLGLIPPNTATQVRLAKDFRNLIHPGRAQRLGQKPDRPTAHAALAAALAVARDLVPPGVS